jgi:hypothetical protein
MPTLAPVLPTNLDYIFETVSFRPWNAMPHLLAYPCSRTQIGLLRRSLQGGQRVLHSHDVLSIQALPIAT